MDAPGEKSKKQSDTNPDKPHENLVFFIDRCLGRSICEALRALGLVVEHEDDHFAQDTKDVDWMIEVGLKGWVVLTRDTRIRFHPNEQAELIRAKLRIFSLQTKRGEKGRRGINGAEITAIFCKHIATIQILARTHPPPFIAGVLRNGVRIMTFKNKKGRD